MKNKKVEQYVLEGISFIPYTESIAKTDLDKINKFAVKPLESKDITVYTALLIDDRITRNYTQYTKEFQTMLLSLPVGEGNFIGAPILFGNQIDHQHTASAQVGRIFDAWQVVSEEKNFGTMSKIYILNEGNEDLLGKINSGVLKEMSIATKVEMPLCSICGQNYNECDHMKGENGCYVKMSGRGFVAEASFVAVPGSNAAKILSEEETKKFLKLENLKETVMPIINEQFGIMFASEAMDEKFEKVDHVMQIMAATSGAMREEMMEQINMINEKLDKIAADFQKEAETIAYKIDVVSTLTELNTGLNTAKEFIIRNLAKYNIPAAEFRSDAIPEMSQGMKGEDTNMVIKILFDNIDILGINLSKLETHLKVAPQITNPTYTGDILNIPNTVRFMVKKLDILTTRIFKLQGQFDLQELERKKVITEATKYGILCGKFGFNEKNLSEKFFENMSTEEIVTIKEKFFKEGSEIFTPKVELIKEEPKDEKQNKDEEKPASLREIAKKILSGGTKQ